jgi:hypothetical protein
LTKKGEEEMKGKMILTALFFLSVGYLGCSSSNDGTPSGSTSGTLDLNNLQSGEQYSMEADNGTFRQVGVFEAVDLENGNVVLVPRKSYYEDSEGNQTPVDEGKFRPITDMDISGFLSDWDDAINGPGDEDQNGKELKEYLHSTGLGLGDLIVIHEKNGECNMSLAEMMEVLSEIDTLDASSSREISGFFRHLNYFGASMCDFVEAVAEQGELEGLLQFMRDYNLGFTDMTNLTLSLAYTTDNLSTAAVTEKLGLSSVETAGAGTTVAAWTVAEALTYVNKIIVGGDKVVNNSDQLISDAIKSLGVAGLEIPKLAESMIKNYDGAVNISANTDFSAINMKFPCNSPFSWEGTGACISDPIDFPNCSYEADSKDYPADCTVKPLPITLSFSHWYTGKYAYYTGHLYGEYGGQASTTVTDSTTNEKITWYGRTMPALNVMNDEAWASLQQTMDIDIAMTQIEPEGSGLSEADASVGKVWVTIQASIAAANGGSSHVISSGWLARSDTGVTYTANPTESD